MVSQKVNGKVKEIRQLMEAIHNIPLFLNNWKVGKEVEIEKFLERHDENSEFKLVDVWNTALENADNKFC